MEKKYLNRSFTIEGTRFYIGHTVDHHSRSDFFYLHDDDFFIASIHEITDQKFTWYRNYLGTTISGIIKFSDLEQQILDAVKH